jgi:hypothetical protein
MPGSTLTQKIAVTANLAKVVVTKSPVNISRLAPLPLQHGLQGGFAINLPHLRAHQERYDLIRAIEGKARSAFARISS